MARHISLTAISTFMLLLLHITESLFKKAIVKILTIPNNASACARCLKMSELLLQDSP
jgi:hypothetical protein